MVSRHPAECMTTCMQMIVSAAIWAAAAGALAGGALSDRAGRRASLALADVLFGAGSLLMACAASPWVIVVGRVLVGFGIGIASVVVPVYIAECVHARFRAELGSANVLAITGGQLASYLVSYGRSHLRGQWRWMLAVAAAPAALQLAGLRFVPETPQWLLRKGAELYTGVFRVCGRCGQVCRRGLHVRKGLQLSLVSLPAACNICCSCERKCSSGSFSAALDVPARLQGRTSEAERAVRSLFSTDEHEGKLEELRQEQHANLHAPTVPLRQLLRSRLARAQRHVGVVLQALRSCAASTR